MIGAADFFFFPCKVRFANYRVAVPSTSTQFGLCPGVEFENYGQDPRAEYREIQGKYNWSVFDYWLPSAMTRRADRDLRAVSGPKAFQEDDWKKISFSGKMYYSSTSSPISPIPLKPMTGIIYLRSTHTKTE